MTGVCTGLSVQDELQRDKGAAEIHELLKSPIVIPGQPKPETKSTKTKKLHASIAGNHGGGLRSRNSARNKAATPSAKASNSEAPMSQKLTLTPGNVARNVWPNLSLNQAGRPSTIFPIAAKPQRLTNSKLTARSDPARTTGGRREIISDRKS